MRLAKRLAFLGFDLIFGIVKGEEPLNSLRGEWSPEVGRGDSKHPSLPLARAERKPFDRKKNIPRATSARTSLKKKPALPLARAERKAI